MALHAAPRSTCNIILHSMAGYTTVFFFNSTLWNPTSWCNASREGCNRVELKRAFYTDCPAAELPNKQKKAVCFAQVRLGLIGTAGSSCCQQSFFSGPCPTADQLHCGVIPGSCTRRLVFPSVTSLSQCMLVFPSVNKRWDFVNKWTIRSVTYNQLLECCRDPYYLLRYSMGTE